jgi:hypothetical protein
MSDIESAMRDFYRVRGLIDGTEPRWKHEDAAFLCRQQGVDVWLSFPNYPNSGGALVLRRSDHVITVQPADLRAWAESYALPSTVQDVIETGIRLLESLVSPRVPDVKVSQFNTEPTP